VSASQGIKKSKAKGEGRERGALGKDEKRQAFQALSAMQASCLVEVLELTFTSIYLVTGVRDSKGEAGEP
jgi:hypothetical protein